ncbi:hypothetical protein JNUCC83_05335 [Vagococcus sp. JNUCC 83]
MTDEQKKEIIESLKKQMPDVNKDRAKSVLSLILLEIESYNTCGKVIPWGKFTDVVVEVLYQTMKIELDKSVSSVRRGDTTISYESSNGQVQNLLSGHKDLIKRLIGCDNMLRFY